MPRPRPADMTLAESMEPTEVVRRVTEYLADKIPITLVELQSAYVTAVLNRHGGDKANAAIALGLTAKEFHDTLATIALSKRRPEF